MKLQQARRHTARAMRMRVRSHPRSDPAAMNGEIRRHRGPPSSWPRCSRLGFGLYFALIGSACCQFPACPKTCTVRCGSCSPPGSCSCSADRRGPAGMRRSRSRHSANCPRTRRAGCALAAIPDRRDDLRLFGLIGSWIAFGPAIARSAAPSPSERHSDASCSASGR